MSFKSISIFIFFFIISCKENSVKNQNNYHIQINEDIPERIVTDEMLNEIEHFFKDVSNVEIYAYFNRTHWKHEDSEDFRTFKNFKNGKVFIEEVYIRNKITLSIEQINKLKDSFKEGYRDGATLACYNPRHLIVFYDNKNDIKGYIEVCFECSNLDYSENTASFANSIFHMKSLLKEFGITYFEETDNESPGMYLKKNNQNE
ncbi:hypothetical protein [Flavobacterium okayamense]|uniref:Lipoprotein n=1 Tax=Flavobacterium okayamense TaxID=2830782 RepID=A0ABM7S6N0_9FLAO|nr:hypothetical protein [Flavobacterium okayamense]BCY29112.1 hypothetical protein KK2020170_19800 [Flavobacterium okayamense]